MDTSRPSALESSVPSSSPRNKRKKVAFACDACQQRKSRCEMVTSAGCHRCRLLGTRCTKGGEVSRLEKVLSPGEVSNPTSQPTESATTASVTESMAEEIRQMRLQMGRMEGILNTLASRKLAPVVRVETEAGHDVEAAVPGMESAEIFVNRALLSSRPPDIIDPVHSGLLSVEQWSWIYDKWVIRALFRLSSSLID